MSVGDILAAGPYGVPDDPHVDGHAETEDLEEPSWWRVTCSFLFTPDVRSSDMYVNGSLRIYGSGPNDDSPTAEEVFNKELPGKPRTPPSDLDEPAGLPWDDSTFFEASATDIAFEHYVLHENVYVFSFVQARPADDGDIREVREWLHGTMYDLVAAVYEHLPRSAAGESSP